VLVSLLVNIVGVSSSRFMVSGATVALHAA
jgi:hypothetical protein